MKSIAALLVSSVVAESFQTLVAWRLVSIKGVIALYVIVLLIAIAIWMLWRGKLLRRRNEEFWQFHLNYLNNLFAYEAIAAFLLIAGAVIGTLLGFGLNPLRLL